MKSNDDELQSAINTLMIPKQHYLKKNETAYDRKNNFLVMNNKKLLCVVVSIVAVLIAAVGMTLWIIYIKSVKVSEHDTKRMTSQSPLLHTEISSGNHHFI